MKIAIICDWLVTVGGAEKVLGELLKCYPGADVFAVVDFLEQDDRGFLSDKAVKTTFIQKLPFARKHYRTYLPLMPLAIEQLDLTGYDLVISSSHAVAKGVITGPDQLHVSYVHSPMRYAWDLQHQYLRESGLDRKLRGYLARYLLHRLRIWDLRAANGVDYFAANSQFIAKRIRKTYRREAEVIYPPVDLSRFRPGIRRENFYLTASRLVPYKRIDLIVEAFRGMPDKHLVVIGDGPEMEKIRGKAGANTQILGYQSDDVLISHLQRARAFVFAAEEDFGLLPVEAQACGTPVIAYGKGGALETVRGLEQDKPSGVFFPRQSTEDIRAAMELFEQNMEKFTVENCVASAGKFSPEQFREKFMSFVNMKV